MASNGSKGKGRIGVVKNRVQIKNSRIKRYIKTAAGSRKFMDVKADSKPFKGVRKAN